MLGYHDRIRPSILTLLLCSSFWIGSPFQTSHAVETSRLFPPNLNPAEWSTFKATDYEFPVSGVIYRGDKPRPINGMPLGGIDTGCLDIETSGSFGWSTIFNHLQPRGGPVNVPFLGVNVEGKTWLMATGEGKRLNNPNNTAEVPTIFPLSIEGVETAKQIDYWGHYPILDMEFESGCPISTGMRAWSPFIPGDSAISNTPGAVLEVHLRNPKATAQKGTVVFNFPGFLKHRPLPASVTPSNISAPERPYLPGSPPFDGTTLPEKDPQIARPDLGGTHGGKMVIADPSLDGHTEIIVALKDGQTQRGFLISFQRNSVTYGGPIDGSGIFDYEVIDILPNSSLTAISVDDIDQDGKPEILAGSENGDIYCYKRKSPGYQPKNLEPLKEYDRTTLVASPKGSFVTEIHTADLTGDGKAEIVWTTGWRAETTDPLPGTYLSANGKTIALAQDAHATFNGCAFGDFNGDGKKEIAIASKGGDAPDQNFIKVLSLDSKGTIVHSETVCQFDLDRGPQWLVKGDFDGDGQDDLLASTMKPSTVWFKRNQSPIGSPNAWAPAEEAATVYFPGFSDPIVTDVDQKRTTIALGQDNSMVLQRRPVEAGGPNLGWSLENWHVGGAPNSMQAAAIGDLSGDGIYDVMYWHTSHELGGHTPNTAPQLKKEPSAIAKPITRTLLKDNPMGVCVSDHTFNLNYALTVLEEAHPRIGGGLGVDGKAWSEIEKQLPQEDVDGGASLAVDFDLKPNESRILRFVLTWYAPQWKGSGVPESSGIEYTHMYAKRFSDAPAVAHFLAENHAKILKRIISWQEAIYTDKDTPGWLADSLVNILHLITECSVWGQVKEPILPIFKPEDGVFGLNECPRGCPQIECIPCSFYGNIPLPYFFPDCGLSTLRGYKNYQFEDGRAPWIFGGCTAQTPPYNISTPAKGYQTVLNGACYVVMVDRHWRITGDDSIVREFLDSVKCCCEFSFSLRPAYGPSQVIAMPTGNVDTEWFEAPEPGWKGYIAHGGGIRLAQAAIARRMAESVGDKDFVKRCDDWLKSGTEALEKYLWAGKYYYNFHEPETNTLSDFVFGYQLDGEWISDWHGLPQNTVFPTNRVLATLDTIKNINCKLSESAAVNYANPDGTPAKVGGYGPYSYFPPEAMMLAMNYMYEGQKDFGMDLLHRTMKNIVCKWGYTWDAPNIMRGDKDTGERTFGSDYYQDMMLWAVPAAMAGQDLTGPSKPGGLVSRVIAAGK
jgi:uncharacterized protein (DUF608 family)